jgi:hypothetical protein
MPAAFCCCRCLDFDGAADCFCWRIHHTTM